MDTTQIKKSLLRKAQELATDPLSRDELAIEQSPDLLESVQLTSGREIALATLSGKWQTFALVQEALGRLKHGTFGICERCEEAIADRRLDALPWAKYCIACQELLDRQAVPSSALAA